MSFVARTVSVAPGARVPYVEEEWRDALVEIERGEITLETTCGMCCYFQAGDMLWLHGLPLVALRNRGSEPAVLSATSRSEALP